MKIRLLKRDELAIVKPWYLARPGWAVMDDSSYPETAFVVEKDNELLAAGFLYISNSDMGFLEWTVTNPETSPLLRLKALKYLILGIKDFCKSGQINGVKHILQFIADDRLIDFYKEHCGFVSTEKHMLMVTNI